MYKYKLIFKNLWILNLAYLIVSGAGSISKVGGINSGACAGNFFYCAPLTFSWCLPGQNKVHGTITRTELRQSWPTVRGQSDL